jgi:exosortase/archaeosortase family protein
MSAFQISAFRLALWFPPLAWLWFVLVNDLRVEWTVNPQYSYGWAVPFLCAYLIFEKTQRGHWRTAIENAPHPNPLPRAERELPSSIYYLLAVLCVLLYAPTRLVQEANPGWRLVSWALALEVIGLTLCVLRLALPSPRWGKGGHRPDEVNSPPTRTGEDVHGTGEGTFVPFSASQRFSVSALVFPLCFFLVAVPWPTVLEQTLIQGLTRADARASVELLGWLAIPAIPHGNVIEVATGTVGIDEACSGIRSFQATLMISLFLGEFYRLNLFRRASLVLGGFALSFLFNLARMTLLVWVAARQGVPAIASWHDPAGVTILLGCFFGLWGLGLLLSKAESGRCPVPSVEQRAVPVVPFSLSASAGERILPTTISRFEPLNRGNVAQPSPAASPGGVSPPASTAGRDAQATRQRDTDATRFMGRCSTAIPTADFCPPLSSLSVSRFQLSAFTISALAFTLWLLLTEISVEAWYRAHEAKLPPPTTWNVAWPTNNPTFKNALLGDNTRRMLRYDEGQSATWAEGDKTWQVIFLSWRPRHTAQTLARSHTPAACLPAAGHSVSTDQVLHWLDVQSLRMPFRVYQASGDVPLLWVYYCLWDDRATVQGFDAAGLTARSRLEAVVAGRRNTGQRSIELVVRGVTDARSAETAMRAELDKIMKLK